MLDIEAGVGKSWMWRAIGGDGMVVTYGLSANFLAVSNLSLLWISRTSISRRRENKAAFYGKRCTPI